MMKKLITTSREKLVFTLLVLLFSSCSNYQETNFDRAIAVFFLTVLQIINMVLLGVTATVLCIVSNYSIKPTIKVLGWIFLSLFLFFSALIYIAVMDARAKDYTVYAIFILTFIMIVISFVFVLKKPKAKESINTDAYLNSIIDDNEVR